MSTSYFYQWIVEFSNYKSNGTLISTEGLELFKKMKEKHDWILFDKTKLGPENRSGIDFLYANNILIQKLLRRWDFTSYSISLIGLKVCDINVYVNRDIHLLKELGYILDEIYSGNETKFFYHQSLLKNEEFLVRRQEELYRKTYEKTEFVLEKDRMILEIDQIQNDLVEKEKLNIENNKKLNDLNELIFQLKTEIKDQSELINKLEFHIKKFQTSLTWKLTKPFREIIFFLVGSRPF